MTSAYQDSLATGTISAADYRWFAGKGPANLVKKIRAPTLIIQGTVDNLFTLDEGVTNFKAIQASGVPVHMVWFCDGHGICLTNPGDPNYVTNATMAWLNRWVKRDPSVNTGPAVDIIDQNGVRYAASTYPLPSARSLSAQGKGTLQLVATGGSGPVTVPSTNSDPVGALAASITPAKAANAVNVTIDGGSRASLVVGAPHVTLTYQGTVPPGAAPTRVFAQIVDGSTGLVLGNQVTPIDVTLDGKVPHHIGAARDRLAGGRPGPTRGAAAGGDHGCLCATPPGWIGDVQRHQRDVAGGLGPQTVAGAALGQPVERRPPPATPETEGTDLSAPGRSTSGGQPHPGRFGGSEGSKYPGQFMAGSSDDDDFKPPGLVEIISSKFLKPANPRAAPNPPRRLAASSKAQSARRPCGPSMRRK